MTDIGLRSSFPSGLPSRGIFFSSGSSHTLELRREKKTLVHRRERWTVDPVWSMALLPLSDDVKKVEPSENALAFAKVQVTSWRSNNLRSASVEHPSGRTFEWTKMRKCEVRLPCFRMLMNRQAYDKSHDIKFEHRHINSCKYLILCLWQGTPLKQIGTSMNSS